MSESKEKGKAPSRTFGSLVRDEIQIQTIAVDMEGGMPSCTTLLDNFLMCYSALPNCFSSSVRSPS